MKSETIMSPAPAGKMKLIILRPKGQKGLLPGILWIHGGGYMLGMAGMVHMSQGKNLAKEFGAVVISPEYRLAGKAPYPAALEECYAALLYMWEHAEELGIDRSRIIVGGESAGGGLAVAVCLLARNKGDVSIALQLPLYPMIDCFDTASSKENHGKVWNTKRNHWGWRHYLGTLYGSEKIPPFASPARETDFAGLPTCYTFVSKGEPFYEETLTYVKNLKGAGVQASVDIYPGNTHAFDMLFPWLKKSRMAKKKLFDYYQEWVGRK